MRRIGTNDYPAEFRRIAREAKRGAAWACEHCGMRFDTWSKALTARNADGKPSILTCHHLNGDKADCRWENLLVCCQACHLHIQSVWRPGEELPPEWLEVPKWLTERGLEFQPSRQLRLL